MGESLSIRQYRLADHDRILQLYVEPTEDVGAFVAGEDQLDADLEDVESAYLNSGGDFLIGELDGQIVAMGAHKPPSGCFTHFLDELPEETAEITRMRMDADYQGQGFGEAIYDELERRARADGFEKLILDTTHRQNAAKDSTRRKLL